MTKCKHDLGWSLKKNLYLFIFPNGDLSVNFSKKKRIFWFVCNIPSCSKLKRFYIDFELKKITAMEKGGGK